MIPETLEDILVVQQHPDAAEGNSDQTSFSMLLVLSSEHSFSRKALKVSCSDWPLLLVNIGGVGCVECDPQKNESAISIFRSDFCSVQPTQCSMQSQAEIGVLLGALLAMAFLQSLVVHAITPVLADHTKALKGVDAQRQGPEMYTTGFTRYTNF